MFRRFRPATPRRINIQVGLYRSRANPAVILALCLIKNAVVIRLKAGHIFTTGYFFQFKAFRYEWRLTPGAACCASSRNVQLRPANSGSSNARNTRSALGANNAAVPRSSRKGLTKPSR